jgi:DNA-binding LacI/PurR family transcriptional regulator
VSEHRAVEEGILPVRPSGSSLYNVIVGAAHLMECIAYPRTTALIAPNDQIAHSHTVPQLHDLGITVPNRMSLLSFDNQYSEDFHPQATVDFGFEYLGYWAFHALWGDLPLPRDRNGDITARPTVIARGTTGPPRRGGLWD